MLSHRNSHQDWPSDRRRHQPLAWNRLWRSLLTLSVAGLGLALRPTVAHASLARIMTISGSVQLRREAWSEFRRANPGTALYGPDLLEPGRGSRIVVICSNGSRWVVPAGTISAVNNGCPGTLYTLVVETDTGALSTDDPPTLRFNLLTGDRVEAAQTDIAAVEAMDLPDMVATLILVEDVYPRYELTGVAIETLEGLVAAGCETAKVWRLLGDLYLKSGLRLLAEQDYETALALATDSLEEQVLTQYGLGTLYARVEKPEKATEYLEAAQAGALELGDDVLAADIAAELP